jgi:hypothetical protein
MPRTAHLMPLWSLLLCIPALGCDAKSEDDDAVIDTADLECFEREHDNGFAPFETCDLDSPCDGVSFNLRGDACGSATYDPVAAACVRDALATGGAATFSVQDCPGGQYTKTWILQSLGDGTLVWAMNQWDDSTSESRVSWRALPDAAYFSACGVEDAGDFRDCIDGLERQALPARRAHLPLRAARGPLRLGPPRSP